MGGDVEERRGGTLAPFNLVVALARRGLGNLSGVDFRHKLTGRHFRQAVEKTRAAEFHFLNLNHGLINDIDAKTVI
jgi:hypothetical protein